jgi:OmpA-OmpF porin, OOP family
MASASTPSKFVPRFVFPGFIVLGLAFVTYLGLRECDCDVAYAAQPKSEAKSEAVSTKTVGAFSAELMEKLGKFFSRKLPSGVELNIPENGVENKLVAFIEDKNILADKTTWFNFDRLLFETAEATLKPESQEQLKNVAEIMKAFPNVEIKLGGYTDNVGNTEANKKLSQERAESVKKELEGMGIDAKRVGAEGYGQEFPLASNDTEEGRQQNRRVAIRVAKK